MITPQFPLARKSGLVVQEVPDELLVYDLDTNKAHCLNQTAAMVWKACDGTNSVADIVRIVEDDTRGKVDEDFVWLAIDQLNEINLFENSIGPRFAGQSRREVIKKIGLASMVALPIVASLVAPQSAMASTTCGCTAGQPGTCPATCPTFCNGVGLCVSPPPPSNITVQQNSGKRSR